ncbi:MAG TPA: hypothetical protein VGM88_27020 [Kofleriaceae bacterium]|jgi:hypothetical protein
MGSNHEPQSVSALAALIEKISRERLGVFSGTPATFSAQEQAYVEKLRSALAESADNGAFKEWGINSADQVAHVRVAIGFDSKNRTWVLNPEDMARQILED